MSGNSLFTPNHLMRLCEAVAVSAGKRINTAAAERRLGGVLIAMDFSNGMAWRGLIPEDALILHSDHLEAYLKDKWPEVFVEGFDPLKGVT